ncbi:flavin reductase [Fulvivirgaceae bacterium BMA12]|uniref:Flavin reductase n=1 Tax=Agaribacillus aureus TaxID=3051825 RepID=A0ABT8LI98_9BACT|nr:flavin reductase [Fulvivirgaceae bacterium BMA12]
MHWTKEAIKALDFKFRLNLINSITGIKPANLIGTISESGTTNLAIFSSVVHLGSDPALIGFIVRPTGEIPRHTYQNIIANGLYTINHIHESFIERAHYTSAKFASEESEFDMCKLTEEYLAGWKAPFVKESKLKIAMEFMESIPLKRNNTIMIIGQVAHIFIDDIAVNDKGRIDLAALNDVGLSGLNRYYRLEEIAEHPYARVNELPDF